MNASRYYEWKPGFNAKIDAAAAHAELERIRQANAGDLTTEIVVDAARDKKSALHPQIFDRGQKAAAEEYYKAQARKLVQSLVVTLVESKSEPVRAFSVVREVPQSSGRTMSVYGSTEEALGDTAKREFILTQALREALAWKRRYAALSELAQIFHDIDEAAESVL